MAEPAIVGYGRQNIGEYGLDEYEAALRRAFVDNRADFIVLDSSPRGQRFRSACTAWALDAGLLYHDGTDSDGQCEVASFRLTHAGRQAFGLERDDG